MNLVLFEKDECMTFISRRDERAKHILKVLKLNAGDHFRSGVISGKKGLSKIEKITLEGIHFTNNHDTPPDAPENLDLICGLARPNSLKRIMKDCATMNLRSIRFIHTDLGEKSYRTSKLVNPDQYKRLLIEGASQGAVTNLPSVSFYDSLDSCLEQLEGTLINFDNTNQAGQAKDLLRHLSSKKNDHISICIGSERGWSARERSVFLKKNIPSFLLGSRPLRSDTAFIAAIDRTLCLKQLI